MRRALLIVWIGLISLDAFAQVEFIGNRVFEQTPGGPTYSQAMDNACNYWRDRRTRAIRRCITRLQSAIQAANNATITNGQPFEAATALGPMRSMETRRGSRFVFRNYYGVDIPERQAEAARLHAIRIPPTTIIHGFLPDDGENLPGQLPWYYTKGSCVSGTSDFLFGGMHQTAMNDTDFVEGSGSGFLGLSQGSVPMDLSELLNLALINPTELVDRTAMVRDAWVSACDGVNLRPDPTGADPNPAPLSDFERYPFRMEYHSYGTWWPYLAQLPGLYIGGLCPAEMVGRPLGVTGCFYTSYMQTILGLNLRVRYDLVPISMIALVHAAGGPGGIVFPFPAIGTYEEKMVNIIDRRDCAFELAGIHVADCYNSQLFAPMGNMEDSFNRRMFGAPYAPEMNWKWSTQP